MTKQESTKTEKVESFTLDLKSFDGYFWIFMRRRKNRHTIQANKFLRPYSIINLN